MGVPRLEAFNRFSLDGAVCDRPLFDPRIGHWLILFPTSFAALNNGNTSRWLPEIVTMDDFKKIYDIRQVVKHEMRVFLLQALH